MTFKVGDLVRPMKNPPHTQGWSSQARYDRYYNNHFKSGDFRVTDVVIDYPPGGSWKGRTTGIRVYCKKTKPDSGFTSRVYFYAEQLEGYTPPPRNKLGTYVVKAGEVAHEV
jgi:hypothetical protein